MKQHITKEQLNALSDEGKRSLYLWQKDKKYHREGDVDWDDYWENSTMSIGQMIEFLDEKVKGGRLDIDKEESGSWRIYVEIGVVPNMEFVDDYGATELADALWEAVKKVLNGT